MLFSYDLRNLDYYFLYGQCLFLGMLFTMMAEMNRTVTPVSTGDRTYIYPNPRIFAEPILAISAVAPPGGCIVFVICIATIESDTASADATHNISGDGNNLCAVTPIKAHTRCPPTRFRGCASGLLVAPYTSTADAPKEPIRKTLSIWSNCAPCISPIVAIPINAPRKLQKWSAGSSMVWR